MNIYYFFVLMGGFARKEVMNEIKEYFKLLRFDKNFHLGLGDVRLTIAMQESVFRIAKEASQQSVQLIAFGVGMLAFCAGFGICWLVLFQWP